MEKKYLVNRKKEIEFGDFSVEVNVGLKNINSDVAVFYKKRLEELAQQILNESKIIFDNELLILDYEKNKAEKVIKNGGNGGILTEIQNLTMGDEELELRLLLNRPIEVTNIIINSAKDRNNPVFSEANNRELDFIIEKASHTNVTTETRLIAKRIRELKNKTL